MLIERNQEYSFNVFKIVLCVIAKMENRYIREFIEHYFFIGINKIIIFDNNEINGEKMDEVLKDYIKNDFVTIYNYRGIKKSQMKAYNEMYNKFRHQYDWIMFFDVDEFLNLIQYKNIHYFLRDKKFDNCDVIHIHWVTYDDNDLIHYDNRPVQVRFTRPIYKLIIDNINVKSIFRTNLNVSFKISHSPNGKKLIKCDVNGKPSYINSKFKYNPAIEKNLSIPFIKHFQCKTVEEFFNKLFRGNVHEHSGKSIKTTTKKKFFRMNKWTQEKEEIANKLIKNYLNKINPKKRN
jgi:hypothetical protein